MDRSWVLFTFVKSWESKLWEQQACLTHTIDKLDHMEDSSISLVKLLDMIKAEEFCVLTPIAYGSPAVARKGRRP